jgi:hypothetical protein
VVLPLDRPSGHQGPERRSARRQGGR